MLNVLLAIGAATSVDLAMQLAGADSAVRMIAYVLFDIGFLGLEIMKRKACTVHGLNTAVTLGRSFGRGCLLRRRRLAGSGGSS